MYKESTKFKLKKNFPQNQIGEDFIVLDTNQKKAHELNPVAQSIWKVLEKETSFRELLDKLNDEFESNEQSLQEDVTIFLNKLEKLELINKYE